MPLSRTAKNQGHSSSVPVKNSVDKFQEPDRAIQIPDHRKSLTSRCWSTRHSEKPTSCATYGCGIGICCISTAIWRTNMTISVAYDTIVYNRRNTVMNTHMLLFVFQTYFILNNALEMENEMKYFRRHQQNTDIIILFAAEVCRTPSE